MPVDIMVLNTRDEYQTVYPPVLSHQYKKYSTVVETDTTKTLSINNGLISTKNKPPSTDSAAFNALI